MKILGCATNRDSLLLTTLHIQEEIKKQCFKDLKVFLLKLKTSLSQKIKLPFAHKIEDQTDLIMDSNASTEGSCLTH